MKCPFCGSKHTARDGFDDDSMDIWKCLACGQTFTQADLDAAASDDDIHPDDGLIDGNYGHWENGYWILEPPEWS